MEWNYYSSGEVNVPHAGQSPFEAALSRFTQHSVEKAVLCGSRAKGNFKPGSDIDLTLLGDSLTPAEIGAIADELDELLLPYQIGLSIFHRIDHEGLREHTERVGKVFYKKEPQLRQSR